jgi:hypothetical protein
MRTAQLIILDDVAALLSVAAGSATGARVPAGAADPRSAYCGGCAGDSCGHGDGRSAYAS